MPIEQLYRFTCGCGKFIAGTREEAKEAGWKLVGEIVTCPTCLKSNPTGDILLYVQDGKWYASACLGNTEPVRVSGPSIQEALASIIESAQARGYTV